MFNDYLIVNKKILPAYFEKVVEARALLESRRCKSVSDAAKMTGISRSTYYKYKDFIFKPSGEFGHRFSLSMSLEDRAGMLSEILQCVSQYQANIITIYQDIPINHSAVVVLTLDGSSMESSIDTFMNALNTRSESSFR